MVAKVLQIKSNTQKLLRPNLKSYSFWIVILVICLIGLALYLPAGLKDKTDDFWLTLDTVLHSNGIRNENLSDFRLSQETKKRHRIISTDEKYDDLKEWYYSFHKNKTDIEPFDDIIDKPFRLMDDYVGFNSFLHTVIDKRKLVVQGVSGSGKTTLIDRVSRMITGKQSNFLVLECVERMEVEYHKEYIGYRKDNKYIPGKLLKFLGAAAQNPDDKFIFIIDDIDKIYPAALFGSRIWKEMDNPVYEVRIDGYEHDIVFPSNIHIISVTHSDVGNVIEMNSEHFRRLGELYHLNPDYKVFLLYLKEKQAEKGLDYNQIKKVLYTFEKTNSLIKEQYGIGSTLGQWSQLRKKIKPEDFETYLNEFVVHVNGFKPVRKLTSNDLEPIIYSTENNGELSSSNDLAVFNKWLVREGFLSELTVGIAFALFSGIAGWLLIRRRKKIVERLNKEIIKIQEDFNNKTIEFEEAITQILTLKEEIKSLVSLGKVKYEEYIFFSIFINEAVRKIESINNAAELTSGFEETFKEFLSDGQIDDNEYDVLMKFLENLKSALPVDIYYSIKNKIDSYHQK